MSRIEQWRKQREQVLSEMTGLEQMRRGSIVEQYVETTRKDGTRNRRGPYVLYSYKEKGKTVSRRITDPKEISVYREQIKAFRRFQELSAKLLSIGERIGDQVLSEPQEVKKTSRRNSKSRKTLR
jgi:uncharacterized protein DUF6788